MMSPGLVFGGVMAAIAAGALGFAYYKGNQACVSEYEYKALQAKVKRQELSIRMYRSAKKEADTISDNAKERERSRNERANSIQDQINKVSDGGAVCVPADFVRQIAELRLRPNSKKQNSRSAIKRLSQKNAITYKDLGPKGAQELILSYELNEQHNVGAIIASRRFHKRIQKIYAGESLTGR